MFWVPSQTKYVFIMQKSFFLRKHTHRNIRPYKDEMPHHSVPFDLGSCIRKVWQPLCMPQEILIWILSETQRISIHQNVLPNFEKQGLHSIRIFFYLSHFLYLPFLLYQSPSHCSPSSSHSQNSIPLSLFLSLSLFHIFTLVRSFSFFNPLPFSLSHSLFFYLCYSSHFMFLSLPLVLILSLGHYSPTFHFLLKLFFFSLCLYYTHTNTRIHPYHIYKHIFGLGHFQLSLLLFICSRVQMRTQTHQSSQSTSMPPTHTAHKLLVLMDMLYRVRPSSQQTMERQLRGPFTQVHSCEGRVWTLAFFL